MNYDVKYNADLWLLAAWFYGNPHLWDVIYYENIDVIGDDPENLTAGMSLVIPDIELSESTYIVPAEIQYTVPAPEAA
jgi:nucleoid-associated protein YgaU